MIRRDYLILGAGVAGAAACEGIREHDPKGTIMMVGAEAYAPYHRRLLLAQCLNGQSPNVGKLLEHDPHWYEKHGVDLRLDSILTHFNVERKQAVFSSGLAVEFKKALLATGSRARRPQVAGATLGHVAYLRTVKDMLAIREMVDRSREVLIVGGGYVAATAASLLLQRPKGRVTLLHRGKSLWDKKLDPETAAFLTEQFRARGVRVLLNDTVNGFEGRTVLKNVQAKSGERYPADLVLVAIGAEPNLGLVQSTPLAYPHGTPVNDLLETDEKGIYAAGDIAAYPCKVLGGVRRFEYWECAVAQGRVAGANMTGKKRIRFEYVPHCTAEVLDLKFDFVGDFTKPPTRFQIEGNRESKKFIARYFQPNGMMGILLCNQSPAKVQAAKDELASAPRTRPKVEV